MSQPLQQLQCKEARLYQHQSARLYTGVVRSKLTLMNVPTILEFGYGYDPDHPESLDRWYRSTSVPTPRRS